MSAGSRQTVNITYSSPGAKPPIYVAGDFTDPPWEPVILEQVSSSTDDVEHSSVTFAKTFEVAEGKWQYKFRLGEGDWWDCDAGSQQVMDALGNQNNVLVVEPQEKTQSEEAPSSPDETSSIVNQAADAAIEATQHNLQHLSTLAHETETELQGDKSASLVSEKDVKPRSSPQSLPETPFDSSKTTTNEDEAVRGRRKSATDIHRDSYVMELPKEKHDSGPTDILVNQDHHILRLVPDNQLAEPTPVATKKEEIVDSDEPEETKEGDSIQNGDQEEEPVEAQESVPEATADEPKTSHAVRPLIVTPIITDLKDDAEEEEEYYEEMSSPLLPHERVSAATPLELSFAPKRNRSSSSSYDFNKDRRASLVAPAATESELLDPDVEVFPDGKQNILERVKTLKMELVEDDCSHIKEGSAEAAEYHPAHRPSVSQESPRRSSSHDRLGPASPSSHSSHGSVKRSPNHQSTFLEPIPQEPSTTEGMEQTKDSSDTHSIAQSLSSFKTALSQSIGLTSQPETTVEAHANSKSDGPRTPEIPSRKSSIGEASNSATDLKDIGVDGAAKFPPYMELDDASEHRPLIPFGLPREQSPSIIKSNSEASSELKARSTSPTRYRRGRGNSSPKGSRSPSAPADIPKLKLWYQEFISWLKQLFQRFFAKRKES